MVRVNGLFLSIIILLWTAATALGQQGGPQPGSKECRPISGLGSTENAFKQRPWVARRIESLTGEDSALNACSKIGDTGLCLIAAQVSNNLHIKFDCLRSDITGTPSQASSTCPADTGHRKMNLKGSIQHLKPDVDAKLAIKEATADAESWACLP